MPGGLAGAGEAGGGGGGGGGGGLGAGGAGVVLVAPPPPLVPSSSSSASSSFFSSSSCSSSCSAAEASRAAVRNRHGQQILSHHVAGCCPQEALPSTIGHSCLHRPAGPWAWTRLARSCGRWVALPSSKPWQSPLASRLGMSWSAIHGWPTGSNLTRMRCALQQPLCLERRTSPQLPLPGGVQNWADKCVLPAGLPPA